MATKKTSSSTRKKTTTAVKEAVEETKVEEAVEPAVVAEATPVEEVKVETTTTATEETAEIKIENENKEEVLTGTFEIPPVEEAPVEVKEEKPAPKKSTKSVDDNLEIDDYFSNYYNKQLKGE